MFGSGVYILAIFPPPLEGGKKRGTFWTLGKKIGPLRKKISEFKKLKFYRKPFLYYKFSFKE
jgi:hypothetical protein